MAEPASAPRSSVARLIAKRDELAARKRQLESHLNHLERKERTRRLIQQGALAEKYLGVETLPQMESLLERLAALRYDDGASVLDALREEAIDDAAGIEAAEEATQQVLRDIQPER